MLQLTRWSERPGGSTREERGHGGQNMKVWKRQEDRKKRKDGDSDSRHFIQHPADRPDTRRTPGGHPADPRVTPGDTGAAGPAH